ncbi:GlxA family transcriptional regulator [Streptomyces sp. NPDC017673]|uniref:GlxA family transcriptional regulator n=1 Tax=unclassified Streptomyces TaxID=2593676 RepID=UPI0037957AAE
MAVLTFPGVQLLDVAGPAEVFTTANAYGARYDVRIVSAAGGPVATSAQVRLDTGGSWEELPARLGTLVVPGRRDWREAVADPALVAGTAALAGRARRVASVCAGAFMLAEAGLLDGRRAATHWRLARELALAYPGVTVETDALFVRDGNVVTSAGVTAGIDLALALVEEDHGPDVAREVARELVVFMARPGGQSQFSARLTLRESTHPVVRQIMDVVGADPSADHDLTALARRAGVSVRHLSRLFRAHTGMTVGRYAESVRLEAAQALLEASGEPVDTVAARAGFGSAEAMRRAFQNTLGVSPTVYRARFRTTVPERSRFAPAVPEGSRFPAAVRG